MAKRVLILSDGLGTGDETLRRLLMRTFLYTVARDPEPPSAVMMMNAGVRLACEGSDSLDDLRLMVDSGVAVTACGTCLDYLGLMEALAVGEVGNMIDGVRGLLGDDAVVTIG